MSDKHSKTVGDYDKLYVYPREKWDEKECARRARYAPKDHWGNRPPKGLVNDEASIHAQYGQIRRFNGGIVWDGEWYQGECRPLPEIPPTYEFVPLSSWGMRIQKKKTCSNLP